MDIYELVNKYIEAGYSEEDAIPKVAQDIILLKIGNSKYHKNKKSSNELLFISIICYHSISSCYSNPTMRFSSLSFGISN